MVPYHLFNRLILTMSRKDVAEPARPNTAISRVNVYKSMLSPKERSEDLSTDNSTPALTDRVRNLATLHSRISPSNQPCDQTDLAEELGISENFLPSGSDHNRLSNREEVFKRRYMRDLDKGRPLKHRINAVKSFTEECEIYSADVIMAILAAAEDMTTATAPIQARKAGFELLQAFASHSGLSISERDILSLRIMRPMDSSNSIIQVNALRQLTRNGWNLAPFGSRAVDFLTDLLIDLFPAVLRSRATVTRNRASQSKESNDEEDSLAALLDFLRDVTTYSPDVFTSLQWNSLVYAIQPIVIRSKQPDDLHRAFELLKVITASPLLYRTTLEKCIELLCLIGTNANSLLKATNETVLAMLKLPEGGEILEVLLGLLRRLIMHQAEDAVRAILVIVEHVILYNGTESLPIVDLQAFAETIWTMFHGSDVNQVDSLWVIGNLLGDEGFIQRLIMEDLDFLYHLQDPFAKPTSDVEGQELPLTPPSKPSSSGASFHSSLTTSTSMYEPLPFLSRIGSMPDNDGYQAVKRILLRLESIWERIDLSKKILIVKIFLFFHRQASPSALDLIIDYFAGECLVSLADENWVPHLEIITERILFDHSKITAARCRVIGCISTVIKSIEHTHEGASKLVAHILDKLSSEGNTAVMDSLADLATRCAVGAGIELFDKILLTLSPMQTRMANIMYYCESDRDAGLFDPLALSNTTFYLTRLLATCLPRSAYKSSELYKVVLATADNRLCPIPPRYQALRMLIRLRCTTDHRLFFLWRPDLQNLSTMLWGTQIALPSTQVDRPNSNRSSLHEESCVTRNERQAAAESSGHGQVRVHSRPAGGAIKDTKAIPPFWMNEQVPEDLMMRDDPIMCVAVNSSQLTNHSFKITSWLKVVHHILQECDDWELYSYVVVHLASQLSNDILFTGAMGHLRALRHEICQQLITKKIPEFPNTGLKKGDIAACLVESLTTLMGHTRYETKGELIETAEALLTGIGTWDRTAKPCIHALAVCCHTIPIGVSRSLSGILQKMSKIITHSDLAVDVLEFLGGLARLPEVHRDLRDEEVRTIFGIAINYLHHSREKRQKTNDVTIPVRHSGAFSNSRDHTKSNTANIRKDLPQYVYALAYHVITIWFLTLKIQDRPKHVGWIAKSLGWKDESGNDMMDDQSQVTLDMMHRTAYLNLGETAPIPITGTTIAKSWIVGMSIITIQTDTRTGQTQMTKRQASGTTHATYYRNTSPLPPHHVSIGGNGPDAGANDINIFPNHVFLQLASTIAPAPIPMQPVLLPDDGHVRRALGTFDRNDTVDGHKVGVIYVGRDQEIEAEILANTNGSKVYESFIAGLGTKVDLQRATFNTQGLDREFDLDGTSTYAWRDRITEIVFHVVTMMPTNLELDPQCVRKKSHVGNDFVNIIFNDSGRPYNVETIPSQFNFVNIVVSPATNPPPGGSISETDQHSTRISVDESDSDAKEDEKQQVFKVQTICSPSLPQISPAATPKIISALALPGFVRQLAHSASVFSLVWSSRDVGEHVSSWRNRLKEIKKLRERYSNTSSSANVAYPGMGTAEDRGGARTYHEGDAWKGILAMGGLAEENSLLLSLDFSRWGGTGE